MNCLKFNVNEIFNGALITIGVAVISFVVTSKIIIRKKVIAETHMTPTPNPVFPTEIFRRPEPTVVKDPVPVSLTDER